MARVLLLDDEPALLRTFVRMLERAGHQVLAGQSFAAVQGDLHPDAFDVGVTDHVLPGKCGLEVISELRRRGFQQPFLVITGGPTHEEEAKARLLGVTAYLAKPVHMQTLLDQLQRALASAPRADG